MPAGQGALAVPIIASMVHKASVFSIQGVNHCQARFAGLHIVVVTFTHCVQE